jgi:flagellar biosynthesis protein FlhG
MSKSKKPARVICISSGKGGVGKTLTTVNLGLALTKQGHRVMLLDADLGLANINIMLGFKPVATLHDVLAGKSSLKDIIVSCAQGFDVIPAASGISEMTRLGEHERISLLEGFEDFALEYDFLIVDTAAGIGENVLYFNAAAQQRIVVVDPEPTSITDAYALIKVVSTKYNIKEFDVVVNQTPTGDDGRSTFAKLAAATDRFLPVRLRFLGSVAADSSVREAIIKQTPLLELYPGTKASRDILRLAKKIEEDDFRALPSGGIQFFFRSLLEHS